MQKSAQELINELELPTNCPASDTLCLAEVIQSRLRAATAGLRSIIRIDSEREAIVKTLNDHLALKDRIITDYAKLDQNNQRLDTNSLTIDRLSQANAKIYEDQHRDDKQTIVDLQEDLASCQSNQKWIFAGGAVIGGVITWKIKGNVPNPFASFTSSQQFSQPLNFMTMPRTNTEDKIKEAIKKVNAQ